MNFEISWHPKAVKNLDNLPRDISARILKKFDEIAANPFRYLEHFEGDGYKLRFGDFRALIDVDFQNKILKVRVFDKRGRVYE